MSEAKEDRDRDAIRREGPIRRDSPLFRLIEWIAREVAKDLEEGDQPGSAAGVDSEKGCPVLPAVVDTTTKE